MSDDAETDTPVEGTDRQSEEAYDTQPDVEPDAEQDPDADPSTAGEDRTTLDEINAERERRLDPANRPEMAEVDNSGVELPTVAAWDKEHPTEAVGTADPGQAFRDNPPDEAEIEEMAAERERRLAPENRPEGAEVDNTGRTFEDGHFVD